MNIKEQEALIDKVKAGLHEGIWVQTGGNIELQRFLKKTYKDESTIQKELDKCRTVMKLKLDGNTVQVALIFLNGSIIASKYDASHTMFYMDDDGSVIFMMDKSNQTMIDGDTIDEIEKTDILTRNEYNRYKNPETWNQLLKIEFEMIPYIPEGIKSIK